MTLYEKILNLCKEKIEEGPLVRFEIDDTNYWDVNFLSADGFGIATADNKCFNVSDTPSSGFRTKLFSSLDI